MDNIGKINKLPIKYPIITSYPEHADLLAVLQNNEGSIPWIMNNYIQLYMRKDAQLSYPAFPFFFRHFNFDSCPCIDYMRINREFINTTWPSFINFVIQTVDMGYYIYLLLDQYYIKCTSYYQKKMFKHPTLIYGYNLIEDTIDIADFYENGKYKFTYDVCTNIEKAFQTKDDWYDFYSYRYCCFDDIILFKNNERCPFKFDLKKVIISLEDYINSRNPYDNEVSYESQFYSSSEYSFGINIYETIRCFLISCLNDSKKIPPQIFYIPLDHKALMIERIKYLYINKYLMNIDNLNNKFKEVMFLVNELLFLTIKYNITNEKKIVRKIISLISPLVEKEIFAFQLLLYELKKSLKAKEL
ncbi:hypothetical protein [Anaerocolumna jejuensis]|uniref:hypothetical protein n=1 Tax=Anaerocolumna jejuensis TaxID=259063 RepID=UPI003F7C8645